MKIGKTGVNAKAADKIENDFAPRHKTLLRLLGLKLPSAKTKHNQLVYFHS